MTSEDLENFKLLLDFKLIDNPVELFQLLKADYDKSQDFEKYMQLVKDIKNICVRKQLYEFAAECRDFEKYILRIEK